MRLTRFIIMSVLMISGLRAALAYLDPGSGSLIIQLLVAAIVGILATFRFWKARFLSLFGIRPEEDAREDSDEQD